MKAVFRNEFIGFAVNRKVFEILEFDFALVSVLREGFELLLSDRNGLRKSREVLLEIAEKLFFSLPLVLLVK